VIVGHWADRIGRRRMTMISIIGFGAFTFLIACLVRLRHDRRRFPIAAV
jgi:MFS family permease